MYSAGITEAKNSCLREYYRQGRVVFLVEVEGLRLDTSPLRQLREAPLPSFGMGDQIEIDIPGKKLNLLLPKEELKKR
jgi:hypothetical protein